MRSVSVLFVSVLVFVAAVGVAPLAAADPAGLSDGSAELSTGSPDLAGDPAQLSTESAEPSTNPALQTDEPNDAFPITLTDATGTEITLDERPERVTTTNPSAAQVMWELDAADQVVGLTQFAHYLDGAESETRTNVSSTEQGVSLERVVGTDPDLVLAPNATSVETVEALRETGLTVYHFPQATDFDDVADKTLTIGQLTGNEQAAHETNAWVEANVEAVSASTADAENPRLLYPLLGGFAVGGETFIHEIIVASGAENVASEEFDGYEVLNDEILYTLDPEVLLVTDQTAGQVMDREPYSLTTAGEHNRSVQLEVNYINQAAPRSIVYSTRNLTAQLHPDRYDQSEYVSRQAIADGEYTPADSDGPDGDEATASDAAETDDADTDVSAPGFGAVAAVLALIGGGLLARRR